ncbi:MAG: DUF4348 domain-containing protein [Bacteroidetes bacterium]|nr:DUF4348 domain-containing protein [Bacteroidota bacterium]
MRSVFLLLLILLQHGNPVQMSAETDFARVPDLALEPFDEFFDRFRASKHFQLKRTVFPLDEIDIRLETETSTATKIEKKAWKPLKFDQNGILEPIGGESVTQEIKTESTVVRMEIRGTDSGIYDDYEFERRVGKWYLVLRRSYSN